MTSSSLDHERVIIRRGERSGVPVIVAVHSTRVGSAVGGCRMWAYADWRDGLADALCLSAAMSVKCAAAGIEHGGGKSDQVRGYEGVKLANVERYRAQLAEAIAKHTVTNVA